MNRQEKALAAQLAELIGCKSYTHISKRCTGKWRGTTDYGLLFDNGCYHFASNGMAGFEQEIQKDILEISTVLQYRESYQAVISEQLALDNEIALREGLSPVKLIDTGINTDYEHYFLWAYALLEVNGRQFRFIETMLNRHLRTNTLAIWETDRPKDIYTAGAVQNPDFIFGNVRFSSTDDMHKTLDNRPKTTEQ